MRVRLRYGAKTLTQRNHIRKVDLVLPFVPKGHGNFLLSISNAFHIIAGNPRKIM
jgi:hypothetical protein